MPCYDHRDSPSYVSEENEREIRALNDRLDKYARMLCAQMRECDTRLVPPATKEVAKWWTDHQESDRKLALREAKARKQRACKRARDERVKSLKKTASKKLTEEERKALGL